jgi:hypothetical protein
MARKIPLALTRKGYKSVTSAWLNKIKPSQQVLAGQRWSSQPIVSIVTNKRDSLLTVKTREITTVIKRLMPNAKISLVSGKTVRLSKSFARPTPATFRILIANWKATATN